MHATAIDYNCLLLQFQKGFAELLLPVHTQTHCWVHVRHTTAAQIAYMKLSITNLYWWRWGG